MQRILKNWRNNEGATVIEFAFVLPVLLLLICGIIEFSAIMLTHSMLEGAASLAARTYKAQARAGAGTEVSISDIRALVMQRVGGFIDPNRLQVRAVNLGSAFDWGAAASPTGGQTALANTLGIGAGVLNSNGNSGQTGSVIQYQLNYAYFFTTPIIGSLFPTPNGAYLIRASMVVQNEPRVFTGGLGGGSGL